jgi:hypothetical protein
VFEKVFLNIQSIVGEIYKAGAKVVFVAEICQRGNFTKAPGLTFQTYSKNKNSTNRLEFSYLLYKRYSVWQRNYYQILQTLPFLNFECLKKCF